MLSSTIVFAPLIGVAIFLRPVLGHCKVVTVAATLGGPGHRSHGFGVDLHGKYPWHVGQPGDAGADAVVFSPRVEYVANPPHPCGQLSILPNGLDVQSHISQAEAAGVATTAADGSFEALIFQVNRDGGGTCTCEYDPTGTAKSWNRCKTLINPPGIQGMWQSDRTNHTAKFQMPSSTVCRGGVFKDKCLMRVRCGYKLRFGGCFVMKTPSSPTPLRLRVVDGGSSSDDITSQAARIFQTMRSSGALSPATNRSGNRIRSANLESRATSSATRVDAIAAKVIQLMQQNNLKLVQQQANVLVRSFAHR